MTTSGAGALAPAAALALALAASACGEPFDPYARLSSLRVLALAAEPAAPAAGETTTLSALVYTPPGVAVDSYQWSWCPFAGPASAGYPCQVTEEQLMQMGVTAPPFDLGTGETAMLEHSIDPGLLDAICGATMPGQPQLVDCAGGFPVQIKLVVKAGGEEITAVGQVRLRFKAEHEPNANPVVDGLAAVLDGNEVPVDAPPGPTLLRGEDATVRAQVDISHAENFMGVDDMGQPAMERERLIVSWFVESGNVKSERTVFIDGVVDLDFALENTWEPDYADEFERGTADLVVVVRDSRGGVGWRRGTVTLGDAP